MTNQPSQCPKCKDAWTEAEVDLLFSLTAGVRQEMVVSALLVPYRGVHDLLDAMGCGPMARGSKKRAGAESSLANLITRLDRNGFSVERQPSPRDANLRWIMRRNHRA